LADVLSSTPSTSAAATEYAIGYTALALRERTASHCTTLPLSVGRHAGRSEPAHILQFPSAPKCIAEKTGRARINYLVSVGIKSCGPSCGSSLTLAPIMPTLTPCEGRSVVRRRKPAALWWRCALVLVHIFVILCLSDEYRRRSHMAQELRKLAPKRNLPSPLICPATILVII
jgi:hypothetical protein